MFMGLWQVILNNLDVSADYIQKLTFEVQQDVAQSIFVPLSDADKERALASLAPLASTASKFKQLLQVRFLCTFFFFFSFSVSLISRAKFTHRFANADRHRATLRSDTQAGVTPSLSRVI